MMTEKTPNPTTMRRMFRTPTDAREEMGPVFGEYPRRNESADDDVMGKAWGDGETENKVSIENVPTGKKE